MLLTGSYERTLDEKNRLTLPRVLRVQLGDVSRLYVSHWLDRCLGIYTQEELERLRVKLDEAPLADSDVRAFGRLFWSRAEPVDLDGHGRILLADRLVQLAGLKKEVMLLGVQSHLEVWDAGRWEAYSREHAPRFDAVAEQAFRK